MKKALWILAGVALVAVAVIGIVGVVLEGRGMKGDYDTYAGTYVAQSKHYTTHEGDRLVLRDDGTWSRLRGTRILDEGGRGTDLPNELDVKRLNWLGPSVTEECYEGVEGHCSAPFFEHDVSDAELIYVPVTYRQTTNKGDFETAGDYFEVRRDGAVLVDEDGVHWVRE